MQTSYRFQRPLAVFYARACGPYADSSPAAWRLMLDWLDQQGMRPKIKRGIGMIRDNPTLTGQFLRRYDACVEVMPGLESNFHAGIGRQTLPGGSYAVHAHQGAHEGISDALSKFHRTWLPEQGQMVDHSRSFLEIYLNDPATTARADLRTEICVPLLSAKHTLSLISVRAA